MKKKLLLTTVLLSLTTFLFGQNFGSIGTQWYYSEHAGGAAPPNSEYVHLQSVTDTVIDGVTTHKISWTYYKHNGDTVKFHPIYVYEQSDTAFMYNFQKSKFQTIYIFNAQQGDTLTLDIVEPLPWTTDSTYRLVIDTVETVILDGISLKKYRTIALDDLQFYNGGYFMDRIGGLDWFFPRATIIPEAGGPIRCYSDNQIDTSFQSVACNYRLVTSIGEINANHRIYIFPNPFQNELTILSEQPIEQIELYDFTGRRILSSRQATLNLENINNGVYILTIYLKSGQKLARKIIKNAL
jgi:hypothetical protein